MRRLNETKRPPGVVAVLDIETIVPKGQPEDGSFPKWPLHRPVVASVLTAVPNTAGGCSFKLNNLVIEAGHEQAFYADLDALLPERGTLVTANGRGFDLPNLGLQAVAARAFNLKMLSALSRAKRFDLHHEDICELFSNHGAATKPSLAEICSALDIPVKTDTHGSQVGELVAAGEIDRVVRYCSSDVVATYVAWLHFSAFRGSDDALIAEPLASLSRWIEADPTHEHLMAVSRCSPAMWARGRATQLAFTKERVRAEQAMERQRLASHFESAEAPGRTDVLPEPPPSF